MKKIILMGIQIMACIPTPPFLYYIKNNSSYWSQKEELIKEVDLKTSTIIKELILKLLNKLICFFTKIKIMCITTGK